MIKVTLKRNEGRTISSGGLWVFDNEIDRVDGKYQNGDIVEVVSFKDDFLGYGYINNNSKIRIRILSRNKDDVIDYQFFKNRMSDAWNYRKDVVDTDCCRIVFSYSDRLPGLIVDKFNDAHDVPMIERAYLETNKIEKAKSFEQILDVFKEKDV